MIKAIGFLPITHPFNLKQDFTSDKEPSARYHFINFVSTFAVLSQSYIYLLVKCVMWGGQDLLLQW